MREPTRHPPLDVPDWNDRAAVTLLVVVAGHLLAVEPPSAAGPLTPDRLIRFVAAHDLPARVAACEESPSAPIRDGGRRLCRLLRAGVAGVYVRVLPDLAAALGDPFFHLDLAKAAATADLDLFSADPTGHG